MTSSIGCGSESGNTFVTGWPAVNWPRMPVLSAMFRANWTIRVELFLGGRQKIGIVASVPVLTFVSCRGGFVYECQNQRDTSKYRFLVWFWI
jgi:hypothetical protein